ncbi:MAG: hypothetical protein GYB50_20485 [Rhodobacteraceae bacterium]|nr:hypothetical protein [Paracoccaceae bacterium]
MADPRKPIIRPDEVEQNRLRQIAYDHLLECTEKGSKATGTTGASFVILGVGMWIWELAELDHRAAAQMLDALTVIYDPKAPPKKKEHAERKRRAAAAKLLAQVDLEMNPAEGSA